MMNEGQEDSKKISVAIQAGGQSSRMGRDKSFVLYEERPMIEIVIEAVQGLGSELLIIANNPSAYAHLNLPVYPDIFANQGPLGGIHTAIARAKNPHILIVACDMPRLNRALLAHMLEIRKTADVIIPRWDKYPEPLHAVYSKACLGPIVERIEAEQLKITGFFKDVSLRFVDRAEIEKFDPQGLSFTNVNTPEELKKVQK